MSKVFASLAIFCFLMSSGISSFANSSISDVSNLSLRLDCSDPLIRQDAIIQLAEVGEVALPWINIQLTNLTNDQGRFGEVLIMALNSMPGLTSDMVYNSMSLGAQNYIKMKAQSKVETNGSVAARRLVRKLNL